MWIYRDVYRNDDGVSAILIGTVSYIEPIEDKNGTLTLVQVIALTICRRTTFVVAAAFLWPLTDISCLLASHLASSHSGVVSCHILASGQA